MMVLAATLVLGFQGTKVYAPAGPKLQVVVQGRGSFEITTDPKSSPKTVAGVIALVRRGFYNQHRFHRVEPWVVQWGDPASRTGSLDNPAIGSGGSGKALPFEGSRVAFRRGVVGIASTGARVGGDAQLFVLTKDAVSRSPGA